MMPHMGRASSGGDSWTSFASSTSLYHLAIPAVVVDGEKILSGRRKEVRCILFTLCNITAFRLAAFPGLVQFRTLRRLIKGEDLTDSMRKLHDLASALDDMVFHCYIRAKSSRLTSIVRQGVLVGGYSWSTAEYPTAAQSYVSEALLFLVFVHAEVTELMVEGTATSQIPSIQRQPLVRRVFEALVVDMMQAMLDAFRMVDGFGEGGAMQAVLEVMVIKQTLDQYLTRESEECIRLLYMYIHSTYKRTTARAERSARSTSPTPSLQTEGTVNVDGVELTRQQWAMLQSLAKEWARRTSIQFRCFQPADTPTSSDM
ncbi:Exocyst complex component S5 [Spiromyces aspiralis]|uniref:Exocyst complex component S5 n=1 Tax=Spiromyces aspiralis TaxID=68401 RepID=A0ACC1HB00_9FUNG|nr:Exocyst complex component S5 [Spiromyces aspiralis]